MLIYVITNSLNGKQYVGQTRQTLQNRWKHHTWRSTLLSQKQPITRAMHKYGVENFTVKEIDQCKSQEELDDKEIFWAKKLNTFCPHGYNLKAGSGRGSLSEETKKKISESNKGKEVSEVSRQKMRESHLGVPLSKTRVEAMRQRMRGIPPSPKTRLASSLKMAKTYILIRPDGKLITVTNLKKFCLTEGLHYPKMCEVANAKKNRYKGWTAGLKIN